MAGGAGRDCAAGHAASAGTNTSGAGAREPIVWGLAAGSLFTLMGRTPALVFEFLHSGTDHFEIIGGAHRLSLPRSPHSMTSSAPGEIDGAFGMLARGHADALLVAGDPVFFLEKTRIVELAARQKLPAIY